MSCLSPRCLTAYSFFFFVNPTATTDIYTLSLHDALPIFVHVQDGRHVRQQRAELGGVEVVQVQHVGRVEAGLLREQGAEDRKSTRLNSSHRCISYAVFCLKKKKQSISKQVT